MLKSNNDNVYYNILYLLSCGVNNVKTDAGMISKMNMENLYAACKFHNLTAFVCITLENADVDVSSKWKEAKFKSIRKNIMLDAEREKLLKFCEEASVLPTKVSDAEKMAAKNEKVKVFEKQMEHAVSRTSVGSWTSTAQQLTDDLYGLVEKKSISD